MALTPVIATLMLLNNIYVVQHKVSTTVTPDVEGNEYEQMGQEIYVKVKEMQASTEWKPQPQDGIEKLKVARRDYTFRGSIEAEASPQAIFEDLWYNGEKTPEWHKDVASVEILMNASDHARIQYNTAHEQANGLVTARDFVILNYFVKEGNTYYVVFKSIEYDGMPEKEGYVRAENGVSAMIMEPIESDPNKTLFTFIMNTDFKLGWVGGSLIRSLYPAFVQNYLNAVAEHAKTLSSS